MIIISYIFVAWMKIYTCTYIVHMAKAVPYLRLLSIHIPQGEKP